MTINFSGLFFAAQFQLPKEWKLKLTHHQVCQKKFVSDKCWMCFILWNLNLWVIFVFYNESGLKTLQFNFCNFWNLQPLRLMLVCKGYKISPAKYRHIAKAFGLVWQLRKENLLTQNHDPWIPNEGPKTDTQHWQYYCYSEPIELHPTLIRN